MAEFERSQSKAIENDLDGDGAERTSAVASASVTAPQTRCFHRFPQRPDLTVLAAWRILSAARRRC